MAENANDYTLSSGSDTDDFTINSSGELRFSASPDFENPADADTDNVYEITITANGDEPSVNQTIMVTVTDILINFANANTNLSVVENTPTSVIIHTAIAENANDYALSSGVDTDDFTINSSGELRFSASPDFENPADANTDNVYEITITASGGEPNVNQTVMITVTDAPFGFANASTNLSVAENTATSVVIYTPIAEDVNDYTLSGGVDTDDFTINSSGELRFSASPDFENPADANMDNVYEITITASDSTSRTDEQSVTVTITNRIEFIPVTGVNNPFDGIDVGNTSSPTFADIDGDNDMDLIIGEQDGTINYYQNNNGIYTKQTGANNPFDAIDVGTFSSPTFADIDGDNDLDLISGRFDGNINYYQNNNSTYQRQIGADNNPFHGIDVGITITSSPTFADIDGDSDLDLIIGLSVGSVINYYQNNNGVYTKQNGANNNPFHNITDSDIVGGYATPIFADIDDDNDMDIISGNFSGILIYYQNDNGVYTKQTGANNNPFHGIDVNGNNLAGYSSPTFADIDGDNDLDLVVGENEGILNYFRSD